MVGRKRRQGYLLKRSIYDPSDLPGPGFQDRAAVEGPGGALLLTAEGAQPLRRFRAFRMDGGCSPCNRFLLLSPSIENLGGVSRGATYLIHSPQNSSGAGISSSMNSR